MVEMIIVAAEIVMIVVAVLGAVLLICWDVFKDKPSSVSCADTFPQGKAVEDPCIFCVRVSECEGVDRDSCAVYRALGGNEDG